jgi:uncharacterized protein RhaS with RHS repeats
LRSFNGQTLIYDLNGNLTGDGTSTYGWDARNHLTVITGGATASFVYDAIGRRVSKNIGGTTTQFLYDGSNSVQELDGSNPPSPTANHSQWTPYDSRRHGECGFVRRFHGTRSSQ